MPPVPAPAPVHKPSNHPASQPVASSSSGTPSAAPKSKQRSDKPRRLKAHAVTTKQHSIPLVPRDEHHRPLLPLNVGIMTVISLGEVCLREHFHTERYIFPVGYEVTRRYLSTVDPDAEVVYHCTILDGGDGPKFQIIPSDASKVPIIASTATGAWSGVVKQANAIRNRQHSNSVSGPDFFGLGQNTIKHLLQELPNANKLRDYVWQHYIEGGYPSDRPLGGRHAAVIPALPEEYDSTMPVGAFYPHKTDGSSKGSYYPPHVTDDQPLNGAKLNHPQGNSGTPGPLQETSSRLLAMSPVQHSAAQAAVPDMLSPPSNPGQPHSTHIVENVERHDENETISGIMDQQSDMEPQLDDILTETGLGENASRILVM
ncbi:hypothetical protein FISHEDRAFT_66325 [Fistulina hepatica ATCC 64428]|uniref:Transforming growth factor beta regulator 1 n=1 Tax=Fistulina hepatica ATCC 64428 TaxID=1128425 RepID=A0A0D7A9V4_9AGAR|nr:hypothetical protein FISHEDRAFT_66325 [Fistulina hepatica ATCC 64428]